MERESTLTPVKRQTLSDLVAQQLIRLVQNDLKEGDRLPSERDLMSQLGVGRSSLREALRSLAMMGLVETRTGEGTFVTANRSSIFQKPLEWGIFHGDKSLKDVMEARALLEVAMLELAVDRVTDSELDRMEEAVTKMEKTEPPDLEDFLEADLEFHVLLAEATRNDVLHDTVNLIHRIIAEEKSHSINTIEDYRKSARYHRKILESVREKDISAAKREMAEHMAWMNTVLHTQDS
jgi:GntR family transcriptional repressor for pyruvate dehydrogenase complex